ncbi:hypothetical protein J2W15_004247 [Pseudarthrobacter sulfonivorans]|nr:hypothetical protein [Pseudarthrobacter sulfonivorans]
MSAPSRVSRIGDRLVRKFPPFDAALAILRLRFQRPPGRPQTPCSDAMTARIGIEAQRDRDACAGDDPRMSGVRVRRDEHGPRFEPGVVAHLLRDSPGNPSENRHATILPPASGCPMCSRSAARPNTALRSRFSVACAAGSALLSGSWGQREWQRPLVHHRREVSGGIAVATMEPHSSIDYVRTYIRPKIGIGRVLI